MPELVRSLLADNQIAKEIALTKRRGMAKAWWKEARDVRNPGRYVDVMRVKLCCLLASDHIRLGAPHGCPDHQTLDAQWTREKDAAGKTNGAS